MIASGELAAQPDPVVEGGDIEVSYDGEDAVYMSVDGGDWELVPIGSDGKGTVKAPIGAEAILFSTRKIPGGVETTVDVITTRT